MSNVIVAYTLEQAIADGVLVEVFKNRWQQLSNGKPIVATAHICNEVSLAGLMEIWNKFVQKRANHPVTNEPFITNMNGEIVWVIDDGAAFTILYPEDY